MRTTLDGPPKGPRHRIASETLSTAVLFLVVVLSLIGTVMVLSASSVAGASPDGSPFALFTRQAVWLGLGLVTLYVSARVDYRRWRDWVMPLLAASFVLLCLVRVPGIGRSVNGAQRWIGSGAFQIQPAELAKLATVVFLATLLGRICERGSDPALALRPAMVVAGVFAGLLMIQPNLGTTIVLCGTVGAMLFWGGVPMRALAAIGTAGTAAVTYLALSSDYRRARVTAFLDPWADPDDTGYQTIQSLIGVASGGVSGTGLGESRAKWGFLPEAHTDFVFAVIGEELGLIGTVVVVVLFAAVIGCGIGIAVRSHDPYGTLLAGGISAWLAIQAFVNVGAVVGILPITGVPLPYVSFGGSSLLATMAAAGILRSVAHGGPVAPLPSPAATVRRIAAVRLRRRS